MFTAQDQEHAVEVRKASIWQRRVLCPACWQRPLQLEVDLRQFHRRWSQQPDEQPLRRDLDFLARWLDLLDERTRCGRRNDQLSDMVWRLLRQGPPAPRARP